MKMFDEKESLLFYSPMDADKDKNDDEDRYDVCTCWEQAGTSPS